MAARNKECAMMRHGVKEEVRRCKMQDPQIKLEADKKCAQCMGQKSIDAAKKDAEVKRRGVQ